MAGPIFVHNKRKRPDYRLSLWLLLVLLPIGAIAYWWWISSKSPLPTIPGVPSRPVSQAPKAGDLVAEDSIQSFTTTETQVLAKENYGTATLPINTGIIKITFQYRSELPNGQLINETARAYLPDAPSHNLPIFAFAPGTTGIGDECAASLEQPQISNWGNYDSHMAMYASQGYAAVTTDYEGMLDSSRIHHYMVGDLEGRAVLDSIRALEQLPEAQGRLDSNNVFLAGYSQGGHAAFWADKIAAAYAPEIKPKGVVGFGPVMSVEETLTDVVHGANLDWFGPYVIYSYQDYYQTTYPAILLPKWQGTLAKDVPAHCIDSDIPFWGSKPENVYTPQFIQAAQSGTFDQTYPDLARDLQANAIGTDSTPSAKRINSGSMDNVVLPAQQVAAAKTLCASSTGPVQLSVYQGATHYNTMVKSLADTLAWMRTLIKGGQVVSTCQ